MLYYIVRPLVRFALKIFFRKIYLSNLDNIPAGKPVILAANHPTAFLEPCILACFQKRGLFYLVRGDIFAKKIFARVMNSLHMLPVYRQRDRGYRFIKQNYSTFSQCHETLSKNRTVMILAEGTTEHEKRLRPLMKGTARIAFGTIEAYPEIEDVFIVPVGVNYTYAERFRSEVYIDFGDPISVRSFEEVYRENANQGINDVTDILRANLEPRVIIIENEKDDELVENLFRLDRSRQKFKILPIVSQDIRPLKREKAIADFVNQMDEDSKKNLKQKTDRYFDLLDKFNLGGCVRFEKKGRGFLQVLFFILGFPFFVLGHVLGYPPVKTADYFSKKMNHITFVSSVMMVVGVVAWVLYYGLAIVISILTNYYFLLLIPALWLFSLFYKDMYSSWKCRWTFSKLAKEEKAHLEEARREVARLVPNLII